MSVKKLNWWSCDFETDTTHTDQTYVWAWGMMFIDDKPKQDKIFKQGTCIDSFIIQATKLKNATLWFHNLKFDGSFIVDYLVRNGYHHFEGKKSEMPKMSYQTLISDNNQWYSLTIKRTKYNAIIINNSALKIPSSVSGIAKTLKLDTLKGSIDYSLFREEGAEKITDEEYQYLFDDCYIICEALRRLFMDKNLTRLTIGSDCLNDFKSICGKTKFEGFFPQIDMDIDAFCRKAYRGGYVYKMPNVDIAFNGCTYDFNSMYPSMMHSCSGNIYPCGEPIYYEGEYVYNKKYPLYIQRLRCEFDLKDGYVPMVQLKGCSHYSPTEYISNSTEPTEITLTSVDLELFFKHYDVYNYVMLDGYMFASVTGIFDDYINKWSEIKINAKNNNDAVMYTLSKLFLNNIYGKFATSPKGDRKVPIGINDKDIVAFDFIHGERDTVYVPVGAFITAYSRKTLLTAIQDNYDVFCYADTDSIHCSCPADNVVGLKCHNTDLNRWSLDAVWSRAKFVRAKTYLEQILLDDGNTYLDVKCAGMPAKCRQYVTWDNFKTGSTFKGALKSKRVKGGCILVDRFFTIK